MAGKERPYRSAWLLSFAPRGCEASERALAETALAVGGLDGVRRSDPDRLQSLAVFRNHPRLLERCADPSLGLWKPAVILEELRKVPAGDVVLYHDVGRGYWGDHAFQSSVEPLLDWTVRENGGVFPGVWLPEDGRNARWTTRACFRVMGCDESRFWSTPQLQTTYSVWQHNERALALLEAWLAACIAVYDPASPPPFAAEFEEFETDRGAQSVLTTLAVKRNVASFGRPHETTSVRNHPAFAPIPATDIGAMLARIARERRIAADGHASPAPPAARPGGGSIGSQPDRVDALFTSVPPRMERSSPDGFSIGRSYQEDCIRSWRASGFTVYSIHFEEELATLERFDGVTYVGVRRTEDDPPAEVKPSLKAMLRVIEEVGAGLSGLINSDILLVEAPGWTDVVRSEVAGSVIAFTRYETNDVDRTCVGWAPWGFDLIFFDRKFIGSLRYCGMRIGETWWDYWLPLWMHFAGAEIKHVEDCVALHLDHKVVSNAKVQNYGRRFLSLLTAEAEAQKRRGESSRLTQFHDYCLYRFAIGAEQLGFTDPDSYEFVTMILNPTVWTGILALLRRHRLDVIVKDNLHHRFLASFMLRSAQYAEQARNRLVSADLQLKQAATTIAALELTAGKAALDEILVRANDTVASWPYRFDFWLGNIVRGFYGKPPKAPRSIETPGDAIGLIEDLKRRVVWKVLAPIDRVGRLFQSPARARTLKRRTASD